MEDGQDEIEYPRSSKSLLFLYGVSFLYTIVIGVVGGMLLKRLTAAEDVAPHVNVMNSSDQQYLLLGQDEANDIDALLTPLYSDQQFSAQITGELLESFGATTQNQSIFRLVINNNGDDELSFENSEGSVVIQLKGDREVLSRAWRVESDNLRARQFTGGSDIAGATQATYWLLFDGRIDIADIVEAEMTLGDDKLKLRQRRIN